MKKNIFLLSLSFCFSFFSLSAQEKSDSAYLIALNQQIDSYVVEQKAGPLDSLYANDFVFSHGSGKVEGKAGWLATVVKTKYNLRQHDSVKVELHPGLAVVKGKMTIQRVGTDKIDRYYLRYIRIYGYRNKKWMLVSHTTTYEYHEP